MVFSDHISRIASTSSYMITSGPESPGPSAPLVDTEDTKKKIEGNHGAFEPAAVEDIHLEYTPT
jgi:hypothetical protein